MNKLITKQTLDSREVAEMMEIEHSKLLRKIDNITKDVVEVTEAKNGLSEYWVSETYKDASGKENRKFEITRKGCEFLANKTTGKKGNIFTYKYIERFHTMEQQLQKTTIELQIQELKELTSKAESLMKLSHKNKLDFNKFIKTLVETKEEIEAVKIYVLAMLSCTKWQEVPILEYPRVIELIKEVAPVVSTKKFKQMNFFDQKGE